MKRVRKGFIRGWVALLRNKQDEAGQKGFHQRAGIRLSWGTNKMKRVRKGFIRRWVSGSPEE